MYRTCLPGIRNLCGKRRKIYAGIQPSSLQCDCVEEDKPILGSSNTAANKDIMLKIWTNGNTII